MCILKVSELSKHTYYVRATICTRFIDVLEFKYRQMTSPPLRQKQEAQHFCNIRRPHLGQSRDRYYSLYWTSLLLRFKPCAGFIKSRRSMQSRLSNYDNAPAGRSIVVMAYFEIMAKKSLYHTNNINNRSRVPLN